jgi:hypothetical protein
MDIIIRSFCAPWYSCGKHRTTSDDDSWKRISKGLEKAVFCGIVPVEHSIMVHIVSHFGSGDFGIPSLDVICTIRTVEKRVQRSPDPNKIPTPILRPRGICVGMTRQNGKNMTGTQVSIANYLGHR